MPNFWICVQRTKRYKVAVAAPTLKAVESWANENGLDYPNHATEDKEPWEIHSIQTIPMDAYDELEYGNRSEVQINTKKKSLRK